MAEEGLGAGQEAAVVVPEAGQRGGLVFEEVEGGYAVYDVKPPDGFELLDEQEVEPGWEDRWREFHHGVVVGRFWVGPPWELPEPVDGETITIDPGRAFGTGAHPTTRLCIELLARITPTGSLLDVGSGSGVLAIAAARLGFDPITCVDVDPVAVETTIANAAANGVTVEAQVLDALSEPLPVADIAVANVLLAPVETILARVAAREAITSGYLERERPAHPGWAHAETAVLDGWAADRFSHGALTEAPSDRLIG